MDRSAQRRETRLPAAPPRVGIIQIAFLIKVLRHLLPGRHADSAITLDPPGVNLARAKEIRTIGLVVARSEALAATWGLALVFDLGCGLGLHPTAGRTCPHVCSQGEGSSPAPARPYGVQHVRPSGASLAPPSTPERPLRAAWSVLAGGPAPCGLMQSARSNPHDVRGDRKELDLPRPWLPRGASATASRWCQCVQAPRPAGDAGVQDLLAKQASRGRDRISWPSTTACRTSARSASSTRRGACASSPEPSLKQMRRASTPTVRCGRTSSTRRRSARAGRGLQQCPSAEGAFRGSLPSPAACRPAAAPHLAVID